MSNLFVIAYDDVATASQVRDKVVMLSRQHLIDLEDVVVVERRESDGKIKLHQPSTSPRQERPGVRSGAGSSGCSSSRHCSARPSEPRRVRRAAQSATPA